MLSALGAIWPECGGRPRARDGVLMRPALAGKEDTSKPGKGKKRKKDATVSTSTTIESPRTEDEGDDDATFPLDVEKLTSELKESRTSSARKGEELSRLQASLEGVYQERASLAEQIGQKDAIMGRLQEEVAAKNAEIIELRGQNEVVASERDILRSELASTQDILQSAQKEAVALSVAKSEAEEDASSYRKDTATTNE
ncbi:uncharacterized protein [Nicotiana sylvestris]|uniref:uncharacterized protein n=1 Tax=Nicotiana sylvestris TaxID=4096 RepID=UPI00388C77C1